MAAGCLDFAIGADLVDPGRINIFERWDSQATLETFRGSGPDSEQSQAMLTASVEEYAVAGELIGSAGGPEAHSWSRVRLNRSTLPLV